MTQIALNLYTTIWTNYGKKKLQSNTNYGDWWPMFRDLAQSRSCSPPPPLHRRSLGDHRPLASSLHRCSTTDRRPLALATPLRTAAGEPCRDAAPASSMRPQGSGQAGAADGGLKPARVVLRSAAGDGLRCGGARGDSRRPMGNRVSLGMGIALLFVALLGLH
jgi:hypothetical protein